MGMSTCSRLPITEGNQNFSKMVDQNKTAIAIENNKSSCILTKFREDDLKFASSEQILSLGTQVIDENIKAFIKMAQ